MTKPVLIFGNGLGMAIDQNHFALSNALEHVWNQRPPDQVLDVAQKLRIKSCLDNTDITRAPAGELELFDLQRAMDAVDVLEELSSPEEASPWLLPDAREFPRATGRYFTQVAERFCDSSKSLPEDFVEDLIKYVKQKRPHIATLNYDWMMYRKFVEEKICSGYDGELVDGFHRDGFKPENLIPKFGKTFGWYMHLHGSPRIATDPYAKAIKKLDAGDFARAQEWKRHLILTHHEFKARLIGQSPILSAYWDFLSVALDRTALILLMGYSGLDKHLNSLIKRTAGGNPERRILVVEWSGSGTVADRQRYWGKEFGDLECDVKQLDNILDFRFTEKLN